MTRISTLRACVLFVLLCTAIAGGLVWQRMSRVEEPKFCTTALPIRSIDGQTFALQTTAHPDTECGNGPTTPDMATLGIDCKVRAPDGTVLDTLTSSREDGTCGWNSPAG